MLNIKKDQDTVVLGENARLLCIFSEGEGSNPRRQFLSFAEWTTIDARSKNDELETKNEEEKARPRTTI